MSEPSGYTGSYTLPFEQPVTDLERQIGGMEEREQHRHVRRDTQAGRSVPAPSEPVERAGDGDADDDRARGLRGDDPS